MQCYTELTPPTAVTHSLSLPFLSAQASNLVVAKTSLLQIFSFKTISVDYDPSAKEDEKAAADTNVYDQRVNNDDGFESSYLVVDSILVRAENARMTKLVLVAEYPLSGTVTAMERVKTLESKSGGESILLAFKDAKLSIIEWDPERSGLSTVSIHYFEQEDLEGSPWSPKLSDCVSHLAIDPASRCAALKFGVRNLAILPIKQGDDDTAMDDWDEELDGPRPDKVATVAINGDASTGTVATPYSASFVLRFSSLDPSLIHPLDLAFLYEYREPTFGILSSPISPSSSLLQERKDHLTYMVFTLDLEQRASTTILAVSGLPYDIFKIIALAPPVGGVLLVGGNEFIHIDQSGKATGIAVNSFAKQCTSFGLADHSELELRLEGCMIQQLSPEVSDMLVVLSTGQLYVLTFRMDGRSVSGLGLIAIAADAGGSLTATRAASISKVGTNCIFIGSQESDSLLLGWRRRSKQANRKQSQSVANSAEETDDFDMMDDIDDDDDDDLYGDGPAKSEKTGSSAAKADVSSDRPGDYIFRIHDRLINIAPLRDITFSKPFPSPRFDSEDAEENTSYSNLQLVAASGRDRAGALVLIKRMLEPAVIGRFEFPEAQGVWTMSARRPVAKTVQPDKSSATVNGNDEIGVQFDRFMIVSQTTESSGEESAVYALTSAGFEALTGTEFEPAAGGTIEAGTLGRGMRVIQVLKAEVRSYDGGKLRPFSTLVSIRCRPENVRCGRWKQTHPWYHDGFALLYLCLLEPVETHRRSVVLFDSLNRRIYHDIRAHVYFAMCNVPTTLSYFRSSC